MATKVEKQFTLQEALLKGERLLSMRDYSCAEMRSRLRKAGFSSPVSDEAVQMLQSYGFLNDARFAEMFVRVKSNVGWGKKKIEYELKNKGVPESVYEPFFDGIDEETEYEKAMHLLMKSSFTSKNVYASASRKLLSKGFSSQVTYQAVRDYLEEIEAS